MSNISAEWRQLIPVIDPLSPLNKTFFKVSLDTRKHNIIDLKSIGDRLGIDHHY